MLTGRRFMTFALVALLCVLVTAGCKRKSSKSTTVVNDDDIFATDTFPGSDVQSGNVSDDKRAMSNSGEDYSDDITAVHNGDRGTAMITYTTDSGLYAHYYNGSTWTPPVHLNAVDADATTVDGNDVVIAFINTSEHADAEARERDGDVLIFWAADDFDDEPGFVDDETNWCLWVSYFHVRNAGDSALNYGFDIDPSEPGFFYGQRVNDSYDDAGEQISTIALVTDGLCGEARWSNGSRVYSYGQQTTNIVVAWAQQDEKSGGVFDATVAFSWFDLGAGTDSTFPLVPGTDLELAVQSMGAEDSGANSRETSVWTDLVSYNNFLFRRVVNEDAGVPGFFSLDSIGGADGQDTLLEHSFFNWGSGVITTDNYNTVDGSSTAGDITEMNSEFLRTDGFLEFTGRGTYGDDEGLSCIVTFFGEIVDGDLNADLGEVTYNVSLCIAEMDITTGAFLNDTENQFIDGEDAAIWDNVWPYDVDTRMSRNGDYIWIAWGEPDDAGVWDDQGIWAAEYKTTRLDSDGLPVAIPALATTLGTDILLSEDTDGVDVTWFMFQDNLGYICGHQSDALEMNIFYYRWNSTATQDEIYRVLLTADADGSIGSEFGFRTAFWTEDDEFYHNVAGLVNNGRTTFNACDAGQDGDIFYVVGAETSGSAGWTDNHLFVGRVGVTAGATLEIDSQRTDRQVTWDNWPLMLIATPAGSGIAGWNTDDSQYDNGANFGPELIHVLFQEAESATAWWDFEGTQTGYAARTRVYSTGGDTAAFSGNFQPTAATSVFLPPFDLDLPHVNPDTNDDFDNLEIARDGNTVGIWFTELQHIYYQEFSGSSNNNGIGWRSLDGVNGDPALVDDDSDVELDDDQIDEFCVRSCTCNDLSGAFVFWHKEFDDDNGNERLQVRVRN